MMDFKGFVVGQSCYARVMGRRFLVNILGVSGDTVWVSFPASDYPISGMGVDLEFHEFEGFQCFHTQVVIGPRGAGDGIVLERSCGAEYLKHRRSWRVPTELHTRFHLPGGIRFFNGTILNISAEGALLETSLPLVAGQVIKFLLDLPCLPHMACLSLSFLARVIREDDFESDDKRRFGLLFIELEQDVRRSLTIYLWDRIRELYPNELRILFPRGSGKQAECARQA